jgi:DNA gyrase subunit A
MIGIPTKPAEQPRALLQANTQDILYLFTADGQAATLPVYQLPQAQELGQGAHWANLTTLTRRDHLASVLVRPLNANGYLLLATLGGLVKRVRLEELPGITSETFTVMNVPDDDALGWARLTSGAEEVVLATAAGQVIRFKEEDVRPMGLAAGGVMGIKLANEADGVVAMDLAVPGGYIWSITDNGMAKATPMNEYPTQGRYGQGVINVRLPKEAAEVVAMVVGLEETELIITTTAGAVKRLRLSKTTTGSRPIRPRPVLRVGKQSRVTGAVRTVARPELNGEETAAARQMSFMTR